MTYCIKCGFKNEPAARFCVRCANPLVVPAAGIPHRHTGSSTSHYVRSPVTPAGTQAPSPAGSGLAEWLAKNRKFLLLASAATILMWTVNYFFFKPHPDKDGKTAAEAVCACEEQRGQDALYKRKEFLQNYSSYHFTSPFEARQKLDSLDDDSRRAYSDCMEKARSFQEETMKKYAMNPEAASMFNEQYYRQQQLCNRSQSADIDKVSAAISNKLSNFLPYRPVAPLVSENRDSEKLGAGPAQTTPSDRADTSGSVLTDDFIKDRIGSLYEEENNIGSSQDAINRIMAYYAFPMDRYYDARKVSAGMLFRIYSTSYLTSLSYHKVDNFQDKITISRQPDGNAKAIVGCRFEFSTSQSPDARRSRTVYNVYVLSKDGKIKSVYQLL